MARFAKGKYALAISDISGQAFPWNEMVTQWNGLFVHYSEFESKQPQLDPKPSQADPTALPKSRPQQPPPDTLRFLDFNPLRTFAAGSPIINVNSPNHQRNYGDQVRFRGAPTTSSAASTDPQFSNIANIDGITGATICQAAGYTVYPGLYTSYTTTLNGAIDATTTDVILSTVSGFNGVATSPFEPTIANPSGTPTYGALVGTEIISYTGVGPADNIQQTFSVKVVSTDSGNKYYIDNVQQDTLTFIKTGTYTFSQSDSSNDGHPLRIATSLDGTEYTTGVTTFGTPGEDGAYTRIVVDSSAPSTLYYKCNIHSGMGGQINVTEVTDNQLTGVTRGAFGSTAASHNSGVAVRLLLTPANNYYFTAGSNATTGQIAGGGYNVSSGPVTLKTIGPQA
jgi:hypothetical protein